MTTLVTNLPIAISALLRGDEAALAAALAPDPPASTADEVQALVARAATEHTKGHTANARRLTHEAFALVVAPERPFVAVGQTLSELIARYGDGIA